VIDDDNLGSMAGLHEETLIHTARGLIEIRAIAEDVVFTFDEASKAITPSPAIGPVQTAPLLRARGSTT